MVTDQDPPLRRHDYPSMKRPRPRPALFRVTARALWYSGSTVADYCRIDSEVLALCQQRHVP